MTNGDNFDSAKAREDFARVAEDQRARILQMAASEPEDRLAALKRRSQQARIERAAYLKENPPPPRPPAVMNPEPIGEQRAPLEVQPRDELQEQIDLILWVTGGDVPSAAEPAPYIDASERPVEEVVGPLAALKAKIDAVRAGQQELTPDELLQMYRDDPPGAAAKLEDAVRALKGEARRKLSELLNVELAELKNLRGMAGEDREREQQIEYLLGLFTRLGEI